MKPSLFAMWRNLQLDVAPDRSATLRAWIATAIMCAAVGAGAHALAPPYQPGRTIMPQSHNPSPVPVRTRPSVIKQGFEIMIVSSIDEGEPGGAVAALDSDGDPTGRTTWKRPVPASVRLSRFDEGRIVNNDDPGSTVDLDIPKSCTTSMREMIGHGVRIPTTWWSMPSTDPDVYVNSIWSTHRMSGLAEAVCQARPDRAIDDEAGIPETASATSGRIGPEGGRSRPQSAAPNAIERASQ